MQLLGSPASDHSPARSVPQNFLTRTYGAPLGATAASRVKRRARVVKTSDAWPELDFIRDEGSLEDARPHEPSGWELIVFELEDEEQAVELAP